ncbi:putative colanic acid biosynthesis glycosyltransferase [Chryseobacterium sp. SLBN-27]|uniref:glycosyltransferase n=1 Tax=Chryseobacterium sp. SLBN-27 TaxID=3042287 RepID=UPI002860B7E7|nr:glycosyltransferase [Chryseobacterium sp. SLBN-27]MDR6158518.1 putative colanic acid biosynthesis glycosyltransferase [Chryseobacterium sp. SLBN-27]
MKIFQISSEVNNGSVGRVAEQIGEQVIQKGWESYIAYARDNLPSKSNTIKIGNKADIIFHVLLTRITDRHAFGSKSSTLKLIEEIKRIKPDLIQLQHLHGYFINIEILFGFLAEANIPVVWTFHDCWSFTGHCAYYDLVDCQKWQTECNHCPQKMEYPKSILIDNSSKNFRDKKRIFSSVDNLTIVAVSNWIKEEAGKSFFKETDIKVIHNGIDISKFNTRDPDKVRKKYKLEDKFLILGVASPWDTRKGLKYFVQLTDILSDQYQILLVGLNKEQIRNLPEKIIGLERTENIEELAEFYSAADVFLNPTLEEALGLTNLEAQACGTPCNNFQFRRFS